MYCVKSNIPRHHTASSVVFCRLSSALLFKWRVASAGVRDPLCTMRQAGHRWNSATTKRMNLRQACSGGKSPATPGPTRPRRPRTWRNVAGPSLQRSSRPRRPRRAPRSAAATRPGLAAQRVPRRCDRVQRHTSCIPPDVLEHLLNRFVGEPPPAILSPWLAGGMMVMRHW